MNNENRVYYRDEQGVNRFLGKMYAFMATAVGVSALVAYLVSTVFYASVMSVFATNRLAIWVLFIVQLGLVFGMSLKADRNPVVTSAMLYAYAVLEGLFFGIIIPLYTAQSVTMAFVSAATVFVVLAFFGTTTKKSLATVGRHAMAALIALIIVMIINLFLQSSAIQFAFSVIGVVIFSALTAWDAQRFRQLYIQYNGQINTTNLALVGALQLYLDFINLFIQLLNIFGSFGGKRS
ncbi:Bax inhibitor-1/YccA family protein [Ligilactobacillus sp. WILCCON 0076]|uniref:Bax inhibitor-1/YccA family protein n=1 Tax=Ligilactobacillus ubinensis TaxID=2876789 RepID=A0A9X2JLM0_9LACO|nr:Bax inhibitor-1/YccA family protein [Ligilactobacillus ubinensis]MCP0886740.1 Bax inhibitor-1/YccA family protein [Ligilactobacillus ubinensis]